MSLALTRITRTPVQWDGFTGAWHDQDLVYQGLRAHSFGNRLIAYYYGYGPIEPPPPYQPADLYTANRWWHYDLTRQADGSFSGVVYRPTGGLFMYPGGVKLGQPAPATARLDGGRLILDDSKSTALERLL
jgi:hypothetical protein